MSPRHPHHHQVQQLRLSGQQRSTLKSPFQQHSTSKRFFPLANANANHPSSPHRDKGKGKGKARSRRHTLATRIISPQSMSKRGGTWLDSAKRFAALNLNQGNNTSEEEDNEGEESQGDEDEEDDSSSSESEIGTPGNAGLGHLSIETSRLEQNLIRHLKNSAVLEQHQTDADQLQRAYGLAMKGTKELLISTIGDEVLPLLLENFTEIAKAATKPGKVEAEKRQEFVNHIHDTQTRAELLIVQLRDISEKILADREAAKQEIQTTRTKSIDTLAKLQKVYETQRGKINKQLRPSRPAPTTATVVPDAKKKKPNARK